MQITKGTIIRTILILITLINFALERFGVDLISTDEYVVTSLVETVIEIAVIVVGFWKNNSFTPAAIKADKFLQQLRGDVFDE